MKTSRAFLSLFLFGALLTATAFAQRGGRGPDQTAAGIDPMMAKLFGSVSGFSAKAEMTMVTPRGQTVTMTSAYEMLAGKLRMEIDMASMMGAQASPDAVERMKSMGMDRMVNLMLPEQKQFYFMYPNLKSYAAMTIPQAAPATAEKKAPEAQVTYTEVGKETLDGHPCVKNKMTIDAGDGKKREGFVWTATDLKNFPIQVQFDDATGKMTLHFKDVDLKNPDASHFEIPADFTKYNSIQEMMQASMMKMMGGGIPGMPKR
jgi:hypothetical protein